MSDRETVDLLQAEAERSQDIIRGLQAATEDLTKRISLSDELAARYQSERERSRLELVRFREATDAALTAMDHCCPECGAGAYRAARMLGLVLPDISVPLEGLAAELEKLPTPGREADPDCTGIGAAWCPVHGACLCDREAEPLELTDAACPLHRQDSDHGEAETPSDTPIADGVVAEHLGDPGRCRNCNGLVEEGTPHQCPAPVDPPSANPDEHPPCKADLAEDAETVAGPSLEAVQKDLGPCGKCGGSGRWRRSTIDVFRECPACNGSGKVTDHFPRTDPTAKGPGTGKARERVLCPACQGTGIAGQGAHDPTCDGDACAPGCPIQVREGCEECGGQGKIPKMTPAQFVTLLDKADRAVKDLVDDGGRLNPEQAARFKRIHDHGMKPCPGCSGSGESPKILAPCPECDGTGQVPDTDAGSLPARQPPYRCRPGSLAESILRVFACQPGIAITIGEIVGLHAAVPPAGRPAILAKLRELVERQVLTVHGDRWRADGQALLAGAETAPEPPTHKITCPKCLGRGDRGVPGVDCGTCSGTGKIAKPLPEVPGPPNPPRPKHRREVG